MADPARPPRRQPLTVTAFAEGIAAGDRAILARAITLIESTRADHRRDAEALLTRLMPRTGGALRVGITGPPGVGKSTLIDALGTQLTGVGHRVAVLAIDPSSARTRGSILGDKTRMARLAVDPRAFVRPSPTSGTLGGVTARTRETLLLCEAAGFDVVLVETVGVGQSETAAWDMTDAFLMLTMPGAGDQLQGIKRGIMELADVFAVNKADGDRADAARRAAGDLRGALRLLHPKDADWRPPVRLCSGLTGGGLEALWGDVVARVEGMRRSGALDARREAQRLSWTRALITEGLERAFSEAPAVRARLDAVMEATRRGEQAPPEAARALLEAFAHRDGV